MIEIDKIDAFYLCNRSATCGDMPGCSEDECCHTSDETFAKNANSVEIFNMFFDTFNVRVGNNDNLIVWEKEKKDGK
jgi:hypothetical protein